MSAALTSMASPKERSNSLAILGPVAHAHSSRFHHGKGITEAGAELGDCLNYGCDLGLTYPAIKPHKDHSGRRTPACVDQFAEIAVFGDEHALVFSGPLQHLIVARAPRDFGDSNHIMTCFP